MAAVNNRKPRGRPFEPGNHANPNGRPKGSKNRPSTLPVGEAMVVAELDRKGHKPSTIARLLDAKPEAVRDAIVNARKLLDQFAPEMARYWRIAAYRAAKHGDHKPAMALLQSVKAIEPIAQTYDTGASAKAAAAVKVEFVNFGFAGLPKPQQPAIEVTAHATGSRDDG